MAWKLSHCHCNSIKSEYRCFVSRWALGLWSCVWKEYKVKEVNVRVIRKISMLEICDPSQPFSRGILQRPSHKFWVFNQLLNHICAMLWLNLLQPQEPWAHLSWWLVTLPLGHGSETACWAAPPGPAQVEQDCTWGYTLSAALSVPGTLSLPREAKGNTGTCWEGCLNDQKHVAVRVMLKKLRCEIIIDQYLLKVWTTELKPHWIIFLPFSFHLIFAHYAICVWIYCLWKVPGCGSCNGSCDEK